MSRYPDPDGAPLRLRLDLTGATYAIDPATGPEPVSDNDPDGPPRLRIMIPHGENVSMYHLEPAGCTLAELHEIAAALGIPPLDGAA